MGILVNREPESDEIIEALKSNCEFGPAFNTISREDLTPKGRRILSKLRVQGYKADGITLHNTKWGRDWCAYHCVD